MVYNGKNLWALYLSLGSLYTTNGRTRNQWFFARDFEIWVGARHNFRHHRNRFVHTWYALRQITLRTNSRLFFAGGGSYLQPTWRLITKRARRASTHHGRLLQR